ncbi:BrnT family toxin [Candidatus Shapirobacteria bacterium]|nr:BrnT family toxin [Candidatus Shapirobacteria bacterium]
MISWDKLRGFEWDQGNIDKSYQKHGITPKESEEVFLDSNLQIIRDLKHSKKEPRFIIIGKSFKKKTLFVVFALRKNKVRVVSARLANKKERRYYEQKIKKDS